MGTRQGKGNRLRFDSKQMLDVLSHSLTRNEVIEGFKLLPVGEKVNLLLKLEAASGAPDPRNEGGDRGR